MTYDRPISPALISVPRIRTLLASLLVSLGSGTNYVRNGFFYFQCSMILRKCYQVYSGEERRLNCIGTTECGQEKRLVDYLSLCSVFATTGGTAEDISYAVEHCRSICKWCGFSSILAPYLTLFSRD